jgi:uncharacterized protein YjbJ (UPF0337 family)
MDDVKGKVKEAVGWATGDRDVEAKGRAEQDSGGAPSPESVDDKKQELREEYGETEDPVGRPDANH